MSQPRVISLLPAATETLVALGLSNLLVGVSHECVLPHESPTLPRVTRSELLESAASSGEIDAQVREALAQGLPLYTLDASLIRSLRPDVILTQRLCDVCAVEHGSVAALAQSLPGPPHVLSLEPATLSGIFADISGLAAALNAPARGAGLVDALEARVEAVRRQASLAATRPRCVLLEWIEPPFCSGHWNPELVEIAGGQEMLGRAGEVSRTIDWSEVVAVAPDVLPIVCCGYTMDRTLEDLPILRSQPGWEALPAVRRGCVYVADGTALFTVPGPRVVVSLEVLAEMLHPELFADRFRGEGVSFRRVPEPRR